MKLDLDLEIANHLAKPDSVQQFQVSRFSAQLIQDQVVAQAFDWQMEYFREHGQFAPKAVLEQKFDFELQEPQTAIGYLLEETRLRFMRSQAKRSAKSVSETAQANPGAIAEQMLSEGRKLARIGGVRTEASGSGYFDHDLEKYRRDILNGQGKGPSLGFEAVDDHFWGQRDVTFVLGPPKGLKSWFVVNAMLANIRAGQFPYLYSLELNAQDTAWRLRCMAADVPYERYIHRSFTDDDIQKLQTASKWLDSCGQHKIEKPKRGERSVPQLIEPALNEGADCIYIDQLQFVENRDGQSLGGLNDTGSYYEAINQISDYVQHCPITVVHQLNRTVAKNKKSEMPMMQQIKGSSAIEEHATLCLGLWSNKDMKASDTVKLGTLASRHHRYQSWFLNVGLDHGCRLSMAGPAQDEEDDDDE